MAALRNLAIGTLKLLGADNITKTTRAIRSEPERALCAVPVLLVVAVAWAPYGCPKSP